MIVYNGLPGLYTAMGTFGKGHDLMIVPFRLAKLKFK